MWKARLVHLSDQYTDYMAASCFAYGRVPEHKYGRIYLELPFRINGHCYYVPLSSEKNSDYCYDGLGNMHLMEEKTHVIPIIVAYKTTNTTRVKGTLRLNRMIPVTASEVIYFDINNPVHGFSAEYVKLLKRQLYYLSKNLERIQLLCERLYNMRMGHIEASAEFRMMEERLQCIDFAVAEAACEAFERGVEAGVAKELIKAEDFGCDLEQLRLARHEFNAEIRKFRGEHSSQPKKMHSEPLWTPDMIQPHNLQQDLQNYLQQQHNFQPQQSGQADYTAYSGYTSGQNPWAIPCGGQFTGFGAYNPWNSPMNVYSRPIECVDSAYNTGGNSYDTQSGRMSYGLSGAYTESAEQSTGWGVSGASVESEAGAVGGADFVDKVVTEGDWSSALGLAAQLSGLSICEGGLNKSTDNKPSANVSEAEVSESCHATAYSGENQQPETLDFQDGSVRRKVNDVSKRKGARSGGKSKSTLPPRFRKHR